MARGKLYIVLFATGVCGVFSVIVSLAAVTLKDRQDANRKLDQQRNVLMVAGLIEEGERVTPERADELFELNIEAKLVELATGEVLPEEDALAYDQQRALSDPSTSRLAPPNRANVHRIPNKAVVYLIKPGGGDLEAVIFPIEGQGLWGTMYSFLAVAPDLETIKGVTFYEHAETPGLGGEIENRRWRSAWVGKKLFDEDGEVAFRVVKGAAREGDEFAVDGLAGATLTANSVTYMVQFWLGEHGFGPYLDNLAAETGGG